MLRYNTPSFSGAEVIDPVSGYSFPPSVNDVHAEQQQREASSNVRRQASALLSMVK